MSYAWNHDPDPEIAPVVDVEITPAPDADRGPVIDVTLTPKAPAPCGTHRWYWARPYTLRCQKCGALKRADR